MKVAVHRISSRNGVLTRMGESLVGALSALGVQAYSHVTAQGDGAADSVRALAAWGPQAVVGFASGCADWTLADGGSIYDAIGCAYVGWDVDHPAYNVRRFVTPIQRRGHICASQAHLRSLAAMNCQVHGKLMLPGIDEVAADPLPIEARPIHALAAMTWEGEPEAWWNATKGSPFYNLVEGAVARALADPEVDLLAAITASAADIGLVLTMDLAMCQLIADIGLFVRRYDRLRLAMALAEADVPRAICGEGWRDRLGDRPHLVYTDSVDYLGITQVYGQARVVFNLNGANGGSERAITGMAAGAVVAADYSRLLDSELHAQGGLRFYDRRDMSSISAVLDLVQDGAAAQRVADRGRELVAAQHLWTHKARALVEMLQAPPFGIDAAVLAA